MAGEGGEEGWQSFNSPVINLNGVKLSEKREGKMTRKFFPARLRLQKKKGKRGGTTISFVYLRKTKEEGREGKFKGREGKNTSIRAWGPDGGRG